MHVVGIAQRALAVQENGHGHGEVAGKRLFRVAEAKRMIAEMESSIATIEQKARFADAAERDSVMSVYRRAITDLQQRISRHTDLAVGQE